MLKRKNRNVINTYNGYVLIYSIIYEINPRVYSKCITSNNVQILRVQSTATKCRGLLLDTSTVSACQPGTV